MNANPTGHPRPCPVCNSSRIVARGPILHPRPALVAGIPIDLGDEAYVLAQCSVCGFAFKDPQIPEPELYRCYTKASSDHWEERPDPITRSWDTLKHTVERHAPGRTILDIGCFNGALLEFLGAGWDRFGVEPSAPAAQMARSRGVNVLGATVDDIPRELSFDVIMAIDVVEHIAEPLPFFRAVARRLRPRGAFIVQTGDLDAWTWRLEGSRYWYSSLPEHVSFYNRSAMTELGARTGMTSVGHLRMPHARQPAWTRAIELLKNVGYVVGLHLGGFGVPPLRRLFVDRRAPGWLTAHDHMLHIMTREIASDSGGTLAS
jgi:SAM-dependent methyltransferase